MHDAAGGRQRLTELVDVFADGHRRVHLVMAHAGRDLYHYTQRHTQTLSISLRARRAVPGLREGSDCDSADSDSRHRVIN